MTTKKHNLSSGKDHITGVAGKDIFVGTKGELGNKDLLNGAGGIDTVSAELTGKHLTPTMKNIERGIFNRQEHGDLTLDLKHSSQMTDVTFQSFASNAKIAHAAHLANIRLKNDSGHTIRVEGIDGTSVGTEKIAFTNTKSETLDLNTKTGTVLTGIDLSLVSSNVTLVSNTGASSLILHSQGKTANSLHLSPDASKNDIQIVTLEGGASINLHTLAVADAAFIGLSHFDASQMTGNVTATIGGMHLSSVHGGSGNDNLTVTKLGVLKSGTVDIDMGDGADKLTIKDGALGASSGFADGGNGHDTLNLTGALSASFFLQKFETLNITNATGEYSLGADVTSLRLNGTTGSSVNLTQGTGLKHVFGSSGVDDFALSTLGGVPGAKAVVELGAGSDTLDLRDMALDSTTQVYYGETHLKAGTDRDYVMISGHVDNISTLFHGIEGLELFGVTGSYDLANSDVDFVWIGQTPLSAFSLVNVASGTDVTFAADVSTLTTIEVQDAVSSQTESLDVWFAGQTTVGNQTFGLFASSLSNLNLSNSFGPDTIFLSTLGSSTDFATLSINGTHKITVNAANSADLFIDKVNITNSAGANILGLIDGDSVFSANGVTIIGGSGADILVGGEGSDTISGGGGNNTIHGSLGVDEIDISGGALDMFVFNTRDQSAFFSGDSITGFNIFDGIDLSDIVSSISFGGNKAMFNDGLATLSTNHSVAFFDTTNHTLYVDVNHDGALTVSQDMEFHLTDLDSFTSSSLIG